MGLNNFIKTYLWNSKPKKNMELQPFEKEQKVLITLTNNTKLEGTVKCGIITVYIDADSVLHEYPNKKTDK